MTRFWIVVSLAVAVLAAPALAETEALMDVDALAEQAPDAYNVKFETSEGEFVIAVRRDWAPVGADRFYNLVRNGFFDDVRFFRVVPNFVVQFGIHGKPEVSRVWKDARIKDDPVKGSNKTGTISFATAGPNSRTTQVFINLRDNTTLDGMGFSPFGEVVEGMKVVTNLFGGYGDGAPRGRGPNQQLIQTQGNAYLDKSFPELDRIVKATIQPAGESAD